MRVIGSRSKVTGANGMKCEPVPAGFSMTATVVSDSKSTSFRGAARKICKLKQVNRAMPYSSSSILLAEMRTERHNDSVGWWWRT